jgi:hypothetical protein
LMTLISTITWSCNRNNSLTVNIPTTDSTQRWKNSIESSWFIKNKSLQTKSSFRNRWRFNK